MERRDGGTGINACVLEILKTNSAKRKFTKRVIYINIKMCI